MKKQKTAFTIAADQLADECRSRYFDTDVRLEDCTPYIDTDVIVAWIAHETMGRDDNHVIADAISERLTADLGRTLLCAVAIDHAAKVLEVVKGAVVEQVARDLMYEAQKLVDNYDPTDSEMARTSYAAEVDDPMIGDRRALARSYR